MKKRNWTNLKKEYSWLNLTELYMDGVIKNERGWFAILMHPGIDGNFADVYGETKIDAEMCAILLLEALKNV